MLRFVMGRKTHKTIPPPKKTGVLGGWEKAQPKTPGHVQSWRGPNLATYSLVESSSRFFFSLGFELLFKKKFLKPSPFPAIPPRHGPLSLLFPLHHPGVSLIPPWGAPLPFQGWDLILCHVTELCLQLLQPSNLIGFPPPSPFWGGEQGIANPCADFAAFGCYCHVPFSPLDRGLNLPGVPGSRIIPKILFLLSSALFLQALQPN